VNDICDDMEKSDGFPGDGLPIPASLKLMVEEPLLAYTLSAMQGGTVNNVKKALLGFFTSKQISDAKSNLWKTSFSALTKLERTDKMPYFVISAYDLLKIPRSMPEELNNISLVDRLAKLKGKISKIQDIVVKNANDIHALESKQVKCDRMEDSSRECDSVWNVSDKSSFLNCVSQSQGVESATEHGIVTEPVSYASVTKKIVLWERITRGPRALRSADRSRQGKKPEFEMSLPVPSTQYMDMHDNTIVSFSIKFF
jgi:hypothetical protein